MHLVRHFNFSLHKTKMTNSQDSRTPSPNPKGHDKAEQSSSPSDPDAITPAPRSRPYLTNERTYRTQRYIDQVDDDMADNRPVSRPAEEMVWPESGGRAVRQQDSQKGAVQDYRTPGEGEARVHQHEGLPEGSAGPSGQAPLPTPREPNLATPSISPVPPRMFTFDSEGRVQPFDLNELAREFAPGSHPSIPDTDEPGFPPDTSSAGGEASVHDDPAPSEANPPAGDSHEAGSREASVHDDSAPPEANTSAGYSHEADPTEHVEGGSVSERPLTNPQNRQSPPPGRQGHDEAPVDQPTRSSSTPDSMAIKPAPPLSSNDGDGSESGRSNVQRSRYRSVGSWNRTFDTFTDQEDRLGRSSEEQAVDRSDTDSTAGPSRQNPSRAPRPRKLSSPDLPPADPLMFSDNDGIDLQQLSPGGASSEQRIGGTDESAPPEADPSARESHGEADSGEHVEGRSTPERPPTASDRQTKP
jgi:hypothetical protein